MLNAIALERLLMRADQTPTSADLRLLDAKIEASTSLRSLGVRRHVLPWGTHTHYEGGGRGGYVSEVFEPRVGGGGDHYDLSWKKGLIAGVEPTIDKVPISGLKNRQPPTFRVEAESFNERGECLVYFRLKFAKDWTVESISPHAASKFPAIEPWTADCLSLILFADGSHWRKLVTNQGHFAYNPRSTGLAQHIFWAKFG